MVLDVAVGAAAADLGRPEAGVLAVQVHAGLLVVTVVVLGALGVAPGWMAIQQTLKMAPKMPPIKGCLKRTYKLLHRPL